MRVRIEGTVRKKMQFIEKDFADLEAAKKYGEEYCEKWKDLKIKKVSN